MLWIFNTNLQYSIIYFALKIDEKYNIFSYIFSALVIINTIYGWVGSSL